MVFDPLVVSRYERESTTVDVTYRLQQFVPMDSATVMAFL